MTTPTTTGRLEYGQRPPGYRLPDATRLGAVRLQVSSLDRSIGWYERVLGMRLIGRDATQASLGARGSDAPLVELRERAGVAPVPRRGRLGLYHYAILLPDRASLGRFIAHLAESGERAGMSDHFVSEAVYLTDPDGLGIEVYADRPRSAWRADGGQLAMATEPLDADDLVVAGGGVPWSGMPAGTVVGHVHLHVGDLGEGERFYHRALGLDKVVWGYPGALFLSAGGYHHHLGTNTWARGAEPASDADARLLEWEIVLPSRDDVAAAANSLRTEGYRVLADGNDVLTDDPWGTRLRLRAA